MTDRRFIEESFAVKEVSEISAKEKNIRHGHISTLHIWWARRPLAASRATAYAALTPAPKTAEEWQKKRDFIIELSKWENSNNQPLLEKARRDILQAHAERLSQEMGKKITVEDIEAGRAPRPRVLDPFAGGGSYPLEALRLGCEAYANDYNPVAVLIEKATLEYPQKFGRPFEGMPEWAKSSHSPSGRKAMGEAKKGSQSSFFDASEIENQQSTIENPLLNAVRYWGNWVLEEARKELAEFYPPDPDGSIPIGYIWARSLPCQNPSCNTEIPLMRQFWLAKKIKKKVSLMPFIGNGKLEFRLVGDGYDSWPETFDPESGTIARAVVACPVCGSTIDAKTTRKLFQQGLNSEMLVAIVLSHPKKKGKLYRIPNENDRIIFDKANHALIDYKKTLRVDWGMEPLPDEPLKRVPIKFGVINLWVYGMNNWGSLFNPRQSLSLIIFTEKIRQAHKLMLVQKIDNGFADAVTVYLALALDRFVDQMSNLVFWIAQLEAVAHTFGRQALGMVWDYVESTPFAEGGSYKSALKWLDYIIEHLSQIPLNEVIISKKQLVSNESAIKLSFPDSYFDAILTDPPYYDNVPYSYISDFFYVWLKRSIGYLFPELFSTPLTPKNGEIVAYDGKPVSSKEFFESSLGIAFREIHRLLKPEGLANIVYAYKTTEGWETVINALLDSGLVVSSAWPINTERQTRLRANEAAALASSIYITSRKKPRQSTGFYNDVRIELRQHLDAKLHRLWEEGIGGADFFIAAIGSAIEVFGKYEQVIDLEGNVVRADRLLEDVRTIATDYAVRQILHNGFAGEISELTRLYVLWRWNYGEARVPFDEARKLAQSCGVDISQAWSRSGYVQKEKEFVRLLGPQNRKLDDLEDARDMIDMLHKTLLLWERGKRAEMIQALTERGYGTSEAFYRVAQAISETLPNESKEKKLLDGFLAGRERVQEQVGKAAGQGRLWEE